MSEYLFALLFGVVNLTFAVITAAFLLGRNDRLQLPAWPLALVGFGLAPFLVTVVLYYLLLLWHGVPLWVLRSVPVLLFLLLAWAAGRGWARLWDLVCAIPKALLDRSLWGLVLGSIALWGIALFVLWHKPLADHDVLEYAVQGRIFLRDLAIGYQQFRFDEASGFHYVGLHGFSYPLLFTWEGLWAHAWGLESDLWVRSLTPGYAWLLLLFLWAVLRRVGHWAAFYGAGAFSLCLGFVFLVMIYHLDGYRIFFFSASIAAFVALLQAPSRPRADLFAVLCGAQVFIHSVGAVLGGVLWAVCLLYLPVPWRGKPRYALRTLLVILACGGLHYVLDILFGTGWILQDIIWY